MRTPSRSARNVITLLGGATAAQAIPVAVSPILTRLYTPEDFGIFALFIAVTGILGAVANGRYELAIMLPVDEDDAVTLAALGILIASLAATALLLLVWLWGDEVASLLDAPELGSWLYLLPPTVLLLGTFNSLNYLSTRRLKYGSVATANVLKSVTTAAVQLPAGLLRSGAIGLLAGYVLGTVAAVTQLRHATRTAYGRKGMPSYSQMRRMASQYRNFPKHSLPAALANSLSTNIGSVFVAGLYSAYTVGQYGLVYRVLGLPSSIVSNSIGQVFFQEASELRRTRYPIAPLFRRTLRQLTALSLLPFTLLAATGADAFGFIFGEDWRTAGLYAQILAPAFAIRFIVSPLSLTNQVTEKTRLGLYGNLSLLTGVVAVFAMAGFGNLSMSTTMVMLSASQVILYLGYLLVTYLNLRQGDASL